MDDEPKIEEPVAWLANEKPKVGWDAEPVEAPMAGVEDEDEPDEKPVPAIVEVCVSCK